MKENEFPQFALPLSNSTGVDDIADAVLANYPTMLKAINVCISVSGLQDEQIADLIGTSNGNFSKYLSGQYNFPPDKLIPLMKLTGNDIPLRWLALKRGMLLKPMQSTLEEENAALKEELANAKRDIDTITRFMQRTR